MDALGEWFVELRTVAETSSDSGSDFASESAPSAEVACKSNGPGQWSSNGVRRSTFTAEVRSFRKLDSAHYLPEMNFEMNKKLSMSRFVAPQ